jgi:arsenate reductase
MVVTVCSDAARNCPAFPGAKRKEHWPFDDPAGVEGTEPEVLEEFRRVRDEIGAQIRQWLGQT